MAEAFRLEVNIESAKGNVMSEDSEYSYLAVYGSLQPGGGIGLESYLRKVKLPQPRFVGCGWIPRHGLCLLPPVAGTVRTCSLVPLKKGFPGGVARCGVYEVRSVVMSHLIELEAGATFSERFDPTYVVAAIKTRKCLKAMEARAFISVKCVDFVVNMTAEQRSRLSRPSTKSMPYTAIESGSWIDYRQLTEEQPI